MPRSNSRRDFLSQSLAAGVGVFALSGLTPRVSHAAAEKLRFAGIGVGGKGRSDILQAANHGSVVAICDIDESNYGLGGAYDELVKKGHKPKRYFDFRKMLEEMGKEIDAVTVSTPDHTHAPASIMAMKMGKHVYCQKPLTHSVYEARLMRTTAKEMKVATQMGNQGTAADGLRKAVELVQGGLIGPVREAHVWTNRPVWPQAPKIVARPSGTPGIPNHIHWYEFLGPAPDRPYHPAYHPFNWRGWWDYGTGALGDMACHTANMAFMALKLGYPTTISAENGDINPETYPAWARVTFDFPARGSMPPVKFVWYEGQVNGKHVLPAPELVKGQGQRPSGPSIYFAENKWYFRSGPDAKPKHVSSGSFLIGEKGVLFSPDDYGAEGYVVTESGVEKVTNGKPEKLPSNNKGDDGMKAEWVQAIRGGPAALSNFDYAAMLTETILLGNVAMRAGKKLEWDGPNLRVTNCPEAAQYIKRQYRQGWEL